MSSASGDLENLILSTVERWWAGRYSERHGLVTSYDSKKHLGKVTYMPEGQESGWLPIETGHIGDSYGIAVGLTPGDGKKTGDQVVVRFQEGDFESGKIVQRVHSDDQKPPQAESGEIVIWTKFKKSGGGKDSADGGQGGTGQQITLKKDGSVTVTDGNGATVVMDGAGNIVQNCKDYTVHATGKHTLTVDGAQQIQIGGARSISVSGSESVSVGGDKSVSTGGLRSDKVGGIWNAIAKFGVWPWLQDDDG